MKLLVDMNLSPSWVDRLARHGFEAVHWSTIGAATAPDMPELLHPRMADVYREKVGSLCLALEGEESRAGAREAIRALIEAILLEPDGDQLKITLKGDLAGMLSAARDSKRSPETGDLLLQIKLVAGLATSGTCSCGRWRRDALPRAKRVSRLPRLSNNALQ